MNTTSRDGFLSVTGFQIFYRSFGGPHPRGTVLCLHGGPGASHDYLVPLADLAVYGYQVVLFDQVGCGRSEPTSDTSVFTISHHIEEVEGVRTALQLGRVHLLGSSYGGLLALSYALGHQENLWSVITTGGLASVPLASAEMRRLLDELPAGHRETILRHEARGEYTHPEYQAAVTAFYRRHVCRVDPWPQELLDTFGHIGIVYQWMNGPNEFTITGTIKDVDLTPDLHRIRVPTLITTGRYDEVTPRVAQSIHEHIPGSRLVLFENSSHLPMWEERERYIAVVKSFLESTETGPTMHPA